MLLCMGMGNGIKRFLRRVKKKKKKKRIKINMKCATGPDTNIYR